MNKWCSEFKVCICFLNRLKKAPFIFSLKITFDSFLECRYSQAHRCRFVTSNRFHINIEDFQAFVKLQPVEFRIQAFTTRVCFVFASHYSSTVNTLVVPSADSTAVLSPVKGFSSISTNTNTTIALRLSIKKNNT